jgi:hypothetical protein
MTRYRELFSGFGALTRTSKLQICMGVKYELRNGLMNGKRE